MKFRKFTTMAAPGLAVVASLLFSGCKKEVQPSESLQPEAIESTSLLKQNPNKKIGHFNQVNLVANRTGYGAANLEPTLINGWGIAFSGGGTAWVSSQGGHVSNVFNAEGVAAAINPVHIPNPVQPEGGNPTGTVFNSSADFALPTGGAARFIFVGVDGVLSAWNGAQGNHAFRKLTVTGAAFTGLALATNGGNNFLYAANFSQKKINVWDKNWNSASMPFVDPGIPASYAPFNIQNINNDLYVSYAKVGADGRSEAGEGKGYVSIFRSNGSFVKRFASGGVLDAPWGLVMVPRSFIKGDDDDDDNNNKNYILVGNFGDGRINAYRTDGKFDGALRGHKDPIEIDGLWAITLPPITSTIDQRRLYFAAGPNHETDGLFGYLIAREGDDD
jgi:uncharacterized protein (TIGR03118 family)